MQHVTERTKDRGTYTPADYVISYYCLHYNESDCVYSKVNVNEIIGTSTAWPLKGETVNCELNDDSHFNTGLCRNLLCSNDEELRLNVVS